MDKMKIIRIVIRVITWIAVLALFVVFAPTAS